MFVIVNITTGAQYRKPGHVCPMQYPTLRGAKTAATRLNARSERNFVAMSQEQFDFYYTPKTEMVRNLMSGAMVEQAVGTPLCCDVSSETYWSM